MRGQSRSFASLHRGVPPLPPGGYVPIYACLHPGGRGTRKIAAKKFPDTNTYPQKTPVKNFPHLQPRTNTLFKNMHKSSSSPLHYEVGDLVCLAYDEFRLYGFGLVMNILPEGDYEIYWFKEKFIDVENAFEILPAELPESWQ